MKKIYTQEQFETIRDIKEKNDRIWRDPAKSFFGSSHDKSYRCFPFDDGAEAGAGEFNDQLAKVGLPLIKYSGKIDLLADDIPDEDYWAENGYESLMAAASAYHDIIIDYLLETNSYLEEMDGTYESIPDDVRKDLEELISSPAWDGLKDVEALWLHLDCDQERLNELLYQTYDAEEEYFDEKARSGELDS